MPGWAAKAPASTISPAATAGPRGQAERGRGPRSQAGRGRGPRGRRPPVPRGPMLPRPASRTGRSRRAVAPTPAPRARLGRRRSGVRAWGTKAASGSTSVGPVRRRAVSVSIRTSSRWSRRGVGPVSRSSRVARTAARSARAASTDGACGRQCSRAVVRVEAGSPAAKPRTAMVSSTSRLPAPADRSSFGAPRAARIGSAASTTRSKPPRRSAPWSGSRNRASSMGSPPPCCASVRPERNVGAGTTSVEKYPTICV